ncbi:hypothetical protein B0H63DRAFT_473499 [Podospora didyma]|uniref:SnoaL-like domain-containing protein n=1 Tax=Podospora didyma TaxID=330526 RepID=A0AAE0TZU2_9PEZI|nr:hypothetical protein B0H63DRAFT_473499 [Podospora didyma]
MSYPTEPAFVIHAQGWDENLLKHPMMKFLHAHEKVFDAKDFEACKAYYASDITFVKGTGETFTGQAAVEAMHAEYAMFPASFHEPVYGVISDNANGGHRLLGYARMFVNLPGGGGEANNTTHADLQGRKWDCQAHGSFLFDVVKDETGPLGYKFTYYQVFANPLPILGEAIKRGIIPVEALSG